MDYLKLPSDEIRSRELRRWLLRLKYSFLLRQQRARRQPRRKLSRSLMPTNCMYINVIIGLAASAYICSSNTSLLDELNQVVGIRDVDQIAADAELAPGVLTINSMKTVLRQRGVTPNGILERKDLEALVARSGDITKAELVSALRTEADHLQQVGNTTCDAEASVYRTYVRSSSSSPCNGPFSSPQTVIFDSVSLFAERIEDNRESLWILSIGYPEQPKNSPSSGGSFLDSATWSHLVRRFSKFDVHFGILLCDRLDQICKGHEFSSEDLIMALPNSIPSRRNSVEFRKFSIPPRSVVSRPCGDKSIAHRLGCVRKTDAVSFWIEGVLSSRVSLLKSFDQLSPQHAIRTHISTFLGSDLLWRKPQSIHLIWLPGRELRGRIYSFNSSQPLIDFNPPLAFSSLSVSFLNRAKLWYFFDDDGQSEQKTHPSQASQSEDMPVSNGLASSSLFFRLSGCNAASLGQSSSFMLITPDGSCQMIDMSKSDGKLRLTYSNLRVLLSWNFPSLNDIFFAGLVCLNSIISLVYALQLCCALFCASFILRCWDYVWKLSNAWFFPGGFKQRSPPVIALHNRVNIITNVVKATFFGWSGYHPHVSESTGTGYRYQPRNWCINSELYLYANTAFFSLLKIMIANLLYLLAALPIINILNNALPCVNLLLWALRRFSLLTRIYNLRLSLAFLNIVRMTLYAIFLSFSLNLVFISLSDRLRKLRCDFTKPVSPPTISSPSTSGASFLAKIFKMNCISAALSSPAHLARYLVLSDNEFGNEQTNSATSSDSELLSCSAALLPQVSSLASLNSFEIARLFKKAMELDRAFEESSKHSLDAADTEHILSLLNSQQTIDGSHPRDLSSDKAPAKLFTWLFTVLTEGTHRHFRKQKSTSLPRKRVMVSSVLFSPLNVDSDGPEYDAGSEEDGINSQVCCKQRRIHRSSRNVSLSSSTWDDYSTQPLVSNNKKRTFWPDWVVRCDSCNVCLCDFVEGTHLAALPCGHAFHLDCVKRWLDTGRLVCPACRWPAHLSHQNRERQLLTQLLKSLRRFLHCHRKAPSTSVSSDLSVKC